METTETDRLERRRRYMREYMRKWRDTDEFREANRLLKRTPEYRAYERERLAKPTQRERCRDYTRERRKDPEVRRRELARKAVWSAVTQGILVRPESCSSCGETPPHERDGRSAVQFHHSRGYDPEHHLTGVWLCRRCHVRADAH